MKKSIICVAILILYSIQCLAEEYKFEKNISYRSGVDMCNLDVAYPDSDASKSPVVVWFHGGGLTKGKKAIPDMLLCDKKIVVGVEYRLYPEVTVAQIIDDAAAAVAWVFRNISKYGGDVEKIVVAGHSAGGYLSTMIGLDKTYLKNYGVDADSLAAIVPYSGQMITHFTERASKGIDALTPVIDELAPISHLRAEAPAMLIITGDREKELYGRFEENAYFARMLKLKGHKKILLYELQGFGHNMSIPGHCILNKYIKNLH